MGGVEKGTIVVVDDEANIADLVGLYLEREGYRVLKAPTGDAGLEAFRQIHRTDARIPVREGEPFQTASA